MRYTWGLGLVGVVFFVACSSGKSQHGAGVGGATVTGSSTSSSGAGGIGNGGGAQGGGGSTSTFMLPDGGEAGPCPTAVTCADRELEPRQPTLIL